MIILWHHCTKNIYFASLKLSQSECLVYNMMEYFLKCYEGRLVFIAMLHRDASIAHYSKCMYQSSSRAAETTLSNTTEHTPVIGRDSRQQIPKKCHQKQSFILNLPVCADQWALLRTAEPAALPMLCCFLITQW